MAGVLALGAVGIYGVWAGGASDGGRTIDYWVAAVPVVWNIAPNGHDAMDTHMKMSMPMPSTTATTLPTAQTVLRTVVYRRYSANWRKPLPNAPNSSADGLLIPGPLIQARVGDRLRIHFKNMDTLRRDDPERRGSACWSSPAAPGGRVRCCAA